MIKVGDLVMMPYKYSRNLRSESAAELGVVIATCSSVPRVRVYWFDYAEKAWEPKKWLEVISAHP